MSDAAPVKFDFAEYWRKRYLGKTWAKVLEENEHFDGEVEIAAAARRQWRLVNRKEPRA